MPFHIVRNDIAVMAADAIVNTANPMPVIGDGVDAAIHEKAGPELLAARKAIGKLAPGECAVTPAFGLSANYVIHVVGPVWKGGLLGEGPVMPLNTADPSVFIHRGGRIPAPMQSLKN